MSCYNEDGCVFKGYQSYNNYNIVDLSPKFNREIVFDIIDTLQQRDNLFVVPQKWKYVMQDYIEGHDRWDWEEIRFFYFKENPEEMFLIRFSYHMTTILRTYNKLDYGKAKSNEEKERILRRFKNEVLKSIEKEAKARAFPDTIIYYYIYK